MKILVIDDSGQSVSTQTLGTANGNVMTVPAPLASMDLILSAPFNLTGTTLSINLATGSLPGLMTAAQFASIAALGTASTQSTSSFATAAQGEKADTALQNAAAFDTAGAAASAQAFAIQRANETGTQLASTISDFSAAALLAVTWSTLTGKPTFATVATSGAYSDLSGLPTLGTAAAQNTSAFATSAQGTLAASALQSNQAITLSGDVAGSGATAITTTLASVGSAGTYSGITTDAKGRVTSGTSRSTSTASRAISTTNNSGNGYQSSSSRDSWVSGEVQISTTATIGAASSGSIILERCATNSSTGASWTEIDRLTNNQTITLAIALNSVQLLVASLRGYIPAGWFYRYRSITPTGTVTYSTTTSSEEVLL